MAKDKSLKSEPKLSKRKKLDPDDSEAPAEEIMPNKIKKKKKMEVEAPVEIPLVSNTAESKKQKKDKKHKKKPVTEQAEIPDPPSCPDGPHEMEGEEDLSPEERRVLERKMKKILKKEEKMRLKAEGVTLKKPEASGPSAPQQALDYLTCWAENHSAWRFQKTRQTWLLQHMFDSEKIPDEKFSLMLQYLEGLQGRAKDTTVQKALSLVEESGREPENIHVQKRAHRAREIIQLLS